MNNISDNLRFYRIQRNKTQKEIANILNIATNTYTQYETGKRKISIEDLIKLADYYLISLDILVGRIKITA